MTKRYLVTGGAGFIGSHLVEALVARGDDVTVVDNFSSGHEANLTAVAGQISLQRLDLSHQLAALQRLLATGDFTAVFHLAANAYIPDSVANPLFDFEGNAANTLRLLELLRHTAPQTAFIYTSSAAVYGDGAADPYHEEDPTTPVAPYGVSKLTGEQYTAVYARLHRLRTASLRLFPVYGPRLRKQVTYDLIQKLLHDPLQLPIYGDGTQVRDLNHIKNVVAAHLIVADNAPLQGEIYNVAADEAVTIRRLAELICELMQLTPELQFSGQVRPGDAQHWRANIGRLRALGYHPLLPLREGLADMIAWCLAATTATAK